MDVSKIDLNKLPVDARKDFIKYAIKYDEKVKEQKVHEDFLTFVKSMWPDFIQGSHHKKIAEQFNRLAEGKINRLIINMPPRHTKSEFASFLLPAWMIGRNPKLKIIQTTHTTELAVRFGRKAKHLIDSPDYKRFFKTTLREDSQAAGRWETDQGGEYFAAGVGSAITGRGADLLIIDDPHSEQDAMNPEALERAYEWYTSGPRQRLQPGGKIVVVMTRWSVKEAVFPFNKFPNVDTLLGPEMKSTGEVMGIDKTFGLAFAKSQFATGNKIPKSGVAFLSVKKDDRKYILKIAQELKKSGFDIIGTSGTSDFLNSSGVECKKINKVIEGKPHIEDSLNAKKIALVINTSQGKQSIKDSFSLRRAALTSGTPYYTTIAGANAITEAIKSLKNYKFEVLALQDIN